MRPAALFLLVAIGLGAQTKDAEAPIVPPDHPSNGVLELSMKQVLEFYTAKTAAPRLVASAGSNFDGRTFLVSPLPAGVPGEAWFLAWGHTFGDTGSRMKVRVYTFDGAAIRTVWRREGLIRGNVTVSGNSVTLEYDKEYHSPERVRKTLHVDPGGLR